MGKLPVQYKVCDDTDNLHFSASGLTTAEVDGKDICIGIYEGNLFACAAKCPHAGGNMAEGYITVNGNIVCPLHGFKFDLKTGRNVSGEDYSLKIFPVEKRGSALFSTLK